jgi:hypothetical protein
MLVKRALRKKEFQNIQAPKDLGINTLGPTRLNKYVRAAGLKVTAVRWLSSAQEHGNRGKLDAVGTDIWVLQARR